MDITENPEFTVVSRWKEAMPQYTVGHNERMKKLTTFMEKELPGIYLAGSSYAGSGLPDCIDQGEKVKKTCTLSFGESNEYGINRTIKRNAFNHIEGVLLLIHQ